MAQLMQIYATWFFRPKETDSLKKGVRVDKNMRCVQFYTISIVELKVISGF